MYEQWLEMEQFYYNDMWIAVIIIAVFGVLLTSTISHYRTRSGQLIIGLSVIGIIGTGIWTFQNYQIHKNLIDSTQFINPLTRSYTMQAFSGPRRNSYDDTQLYRLAYLPQSFENIGLYDDHTIEEEIEYVGKNGRYYYFNIDDEMYYTSDRNVIFTNEIESTIRQGVQYTISDPQMVDLGFNPESEIFYLRYVVPNELEELTADDEETDEAIYQGSLDSLDQWMMP